MDYAQDGDLSRYDAGEIADAMMWEEDPDKLVSSLQTSGFLDGMEIHDWSEFGGKYLEKKTKNAERMRKKREDERSKSVQPRATHVQTQTEDVQSRASLEERRGEEITGEDIIPPTPLVEDEEEADAPPPQDWRSAFRDQYIRDPSPLDAQDVDRCLAGGMDPALIPVALQRCKEQGARKPDRLLASIVTAWFGNGIRTPTDLEAAPAGREEPKGRDSPRYDYGEVLSRDEWLERQRREENEKADYVRRRMAELQGGWVV